MTQTVAARRARPHPRAALEARLAVKVLDAWLQNRHQTLAPLTMNLRRLEPAQRRAVLHMAAAAATSGLASAERSAHTRAWLGMAGADPAELATLDAVLAQPPSLFQVFREVDQAGVQAIAYAAAVAALDARQPANRCFLEFLATRLGLASSVMRSINRRFQH